ncbi:hypothetical protein HOY82DRAFT_38356 [Tuber indicum]|nr:hypothetical protein HOY82DRAFT_38356 [Tuber indicum]
MVKLLLSQIIMVIPNGICGYSDLGRLEKLGVWYHTGLGVFGTDEEPAVGLLALVLEGNSKTGVCRQLVPCGEEGQ